MTAVGQIIFSQEITSFYLVTFLMCLIFTIPIDITCISTLLGRLGHSDSRLLEMLLHYHGHDILRL